MPERKPLLVLDFDGVIHSYVSGWKGAETVTDPPVEGAMEFIAKAQGLFRVAVFGSRTNQPGGLAAMQEYVARNLLKTFKQPNYASAIFRRIEWPTEKPPAKVSIDDRAITFTGVFPPLAQLVNFTPWNENLKKRQKSA